MAPNAPHHTTPEGQRKTATIIPPSMPGIINAAPAKTPLQNGGGFRNVDRVGRVDRTT